MLYQHCSLYDRFRILLCCGELALPIFFLVYSDYPAVLELHVEVETNTFRHLSGLIVPEWDDGMMVLCLSWFRPTGRRDYALVVDRGCFVLHSHPSAIHKYLNLSRSSVGNRFAVVDPYTARAKILVNLTSGVQGAS